MLATLEQPGCCRISSNARRKACIEIRKLRSSPFAVLLLELRIWFRVAGFRIAAELAQRRLVELKQDPVQLLGFRITGCEALSCKSYPTADEGVAVLVADFTIVIAVAIVQTCVAHAALHGDRERQHSPAGLRWQLGFSGRSFLLVKQQPVPADYGGGYRDGRVGWQPPASWRTTRVR